MNTINPQKSNRISLVIIVILCVLSLGSVFAILFPEKSSTGYMADIYQDGNLLRSIPLHEASDNYTFEIRGENGCLNVVEVKSGSIAIVSADCPDKLCVHQGAVSNSLLPITCLPNRVVIQLRPVAGTGHAENHNLKGNSATTDSVTPDIITH